MYALGGLGPTIIAVMWVEVALGIAFVGLRVYCRTTMTAKAGWDDVLMVASAILLTMYTVFCTIAAVYGFGQHTALLTTDEFIEANKNEIIGQTFCIIGIATSKAGVAAFLLRIVEKTWHKAVLIAATVATTGICIVVALFDFIRCSPVASVWDPLITDAVCWVSTSSFTDLSVSLSVICAAADFIFAALPWIALWNLKIEKTTKKVICSAMSLGIFAGVCGIVRAVQLEGLNARSDYTYETVGLILWSSTELVVTIMTACIPTYKELWLRVFGHGTQSGRSSYFRSGEKKDSYRLEDRSGRGNSRLEYGGSRGLGGKTETSIYYGETDDRSDRGILREGSSAGREGIKMTSDVIVSVDGQARDKF